MEAVALTRERLGHLGSLLPRVTPRDGRAARLGERRVGGGAPLGEIVAVLLKHLVVRGFEPAFDALDLLGERLANEAADGDREELDPSRRRFVLTYRGVEVVAEVDARPVEAAIGD